MFVPITWLIVVPILCLVAGMVLGSCVGPGSDHDAWSDGYLAGYHAAMNELHQMENLGRPSRPLAHHPLVGG